MLFRLVVKKNGKRSNVIEARPPATRIGRAHGNEIRIPSAQVSRQHCRLQMKDGLVMVEDLGSVNGTFLNDALITGLAVVRPGDKVGVGPVTFVVEYQLTPKALKRLDEMEFEVTTEAAEEDDAIDVVEVEDEVTLDEPPAKPSRRPTKVEQVFEVEEAVDEEYDVQEAVDEECEVKEADEEAYEVKEAVEEEYVPRSGLEDISWVRSEDGDLRDVLSQLDEGAESMQPKKRAGPRKPSDKSKRKPEPEE